MAALSNPPKWILLLYSGLLTFYGLQNICRVSRSLKLPSLSITTVTTSVAMYDMYAQLYPVLGNMCQKLLLRTFPAITARVENSFWFNAYLPVLAEQQPVSSTLLGQNLILLHIPPIFHVHKFKRIKAGNTGLLSPLTRHYKYTHLKIPYFYKYEKTIEFENMADM